MNIYLIQQSFNSGWDTYDSAVVIAESEEAARLIHPSGDKEADSRYDWCDPRHVTVELVGTALPTAQPNFVVCASFNAG